MSVREATMDDLTAIQRVARASWRADYPDILSRETVDEGVEEWYSDERLRTEIAQPDSIVLVAESDGEVVGFGHAVVTGAEGTVLRVYVHPDARRAGVGSALLERARDALVERGVDRVEAMVLAENDPGNEFYAALGFEPDGQGETTIGGDTYKEHVYALEV